MYETVDDPNILVRQAEELFYQHQVDMIFTGHVHDTSEWAQSTRQRALLLLQMAAIALLSISYRAVAAIGRATRAAGQLMMTFSLSLALWRDAWRADLNCGSGGATLKWAFYRSEDNEFSTPPLTRLWSIN